MDCETNNMVPAGKMKLLTLKLEESLIEMGYEYFGCNHLPFRKQSESRAELLETISALAEHSDRNCHYRQCDWLRLLTGQVKPSREVV